MRTVRRLWDFAYRSRSTPSIAGGEALGAGEIVLVALIFCLELVLWLGLVVAELLAALIKWRRPKARSTAYDLATEQGAAEEREGATCMC